MLLGVSGGPRLGPVLPDRPSAKPAVALVVDGAVYLVDAGSTPRASWCPPAWASVASRTSSSPITTSTTPPACPAWRCTGGRRARAPVSPSRVLGPADDVGHGRAASDRLRRGGAAVLGRWRVRHLAGAVAVRRPAARGRRASTPSWRTTGVRVEATRVFHGPEVAHAYAYRFTVKSTGKVVVFSGDTAAPDAEPDRAGPGLRRARARDAGQRRRRATGRLLPVARAGRGR